MHIHMRIKLFMVALEARVQGGGCILAVLSIQFVYADTKTFISADVFLQSISPNKIKKMIFYICILKLNAYKS